MIKGEENPNQLIVEDLRELSRAYGGVSRLNTLRRLSVHLGLDERDGGQTIESVLLEAIDALPPAYGRAAHVLFSPGGRTLRGRQQEAATELGMSWESFRKRYVLNFYDEFAQQLRRIIEQQESAVAAQPVSDDRAAARQLANEMMASSPKAVLLVDGFLMVKTADHFVGVTLSPDQLEEFNRRRSELLGDVDAALKFLMETHG